MKTLQTFSSIHAQVHLRFKSIRQGKQGFGMAPHSDFLAELVPHDGST